MNNKTYLILFIFLLAIGGFYIYNKYQKAPSINFSQLSLSTLDGLPFEISSLKGKKVILSFGASWCGNCIEELDDLAKIKDKELSDVEVIVISDEAIETILNFKNKRQYPFTFIKLNKAFPEIGINSIPVSFIFNTQLEVKKETVGYVDWKDNSTLKHLKTLMD